jgi:diguanylate cyclase (GGDEF)-like protein
MYDPLIVDTFVKCYKDFSGDQIHDKSPQGVSLSAISGVPNSSAPTNSPSLNEIAASADEMLTLYDLARALAGQVSSADASDVISKHLRRLIPSSLCVFFMYNPATDELEATHAFGETSAVVKGLRIPLGQRLSGWVAANRHTIINSDASLDLGDMARGTAIKLKSCLSTPFTVGDQLLGVLTLYSQSDEGFNDDHRRIIESIAKQIGHTFRSAVDLDAPTRKDGLTGLPNVMQLEHMLRSTSSTGNVSAIEFALLFVDVVRLKEINNEHGRNIGDDVLRHVVQQTQKTMRIGDILFRYRSDEFVVFLGGASSAEAHRLSEAIRNSVSVAAVRTSNQSTLNVDVTVTPVFFPTDGTSLGDLVSVARARSSPRVTVESSIH